MLYFIYELVDPRTDVTAYIGITNNPNQRYQEHIDGVERKGKKYEWIKSLQEEQIQPKMKILEVVDDLEQVRRQERYWIQQYLSKGIPLVNTLLVNSIRERRKQTSKTMPPEGYITVTEASSRLNVSNSMVWQYAQRGRIRYLRPPGRKKGFYLEKDVSGIINELRESYKMAEKYAREA